MTAFAGEIIAWVVLAAVTVIVVFSFILIWKVAHKMGVVADTLNTVSSDLTEARDEILAQLDKLTNKPTLDDDDRAALSRVADQAKALADIVPNAVVVPLPDPQDTGDLDDTDEDVVSPDSPVAEVPAPAVDPDFSTPADASAGDVEPGGIPAGQAPIEGGGDAPAQTDSNPGADPSTSQL